MSPPLVSGGIFDDFVGIPVKAAAKVALEVLNGWIVTAAQQMLGEVVKAISLVSTPSLTVSWFSSSYWRIAGLAMLLTVPFLFAAAVQAVLRSDLAILLRAAFVDLPVAVLAVTITAPLIGLLLAATDEMCAVVTGGGTPGGSFFTVASTNLSVVHSGFVLLVIAFVMLLAGLALMVELIMRAAAIYIVVLFLPLGFAAMVWPARRVWVKRMIELLIALILSKFAMVAVLSLAVTGLASFGAGDASLTTAVTAMALMVLAAFSPWALLRLLPFTEVAAGHGAMLGQEVSQGAARGRRSGQKAAETIMDPIGAGFNALEHLVRGSGTSGSDPNNANRGGGLAQLRGGLEPNNGTPGRSGASGSSGESPDAGDGLGPASPASGTGDGTAGSVSTGGGSDESAGGVMGFAGGGGGSGPPLGGESTSMGRSAAGVAGSSSDPGLSPAADPPVKDGMEIFRRTTGETEVHLGARGKPFMVLGEDGRAGARERDLQGDRDGLGGGDKSNGASR